VNTDLKAIERILIRSNGSIAVAAKKLKLDYRELKAIVSQHPCLKDALLEGHELALDKAERMIRKALRGESTNLQLQAARRIVRTSGRW
jgi:hypothetical protein